MTEAHRNATSLYAIKGGQIGNNILTELLRGLSSYNLWIELGNVGTEEDYLEWLKGPRGIPGIGIQGIQGPPGPAGGVASDPGSSFILYAQKYAPGTSGHLTIGENDGDPDAVFVAPIGFTMDCLTFAVSDIDGLDNQMTIQVYVNGSLAHGSVIAAGAGRTTVTDDLIDVTVAAGDTVNLKYTATGTNNAMTVTTAIHCTSGRGGGFFDLRYEQAQWSTGGFWMSMGDRNSYGREGMPAPMAYQLDTVTIDFDRAPDVTGGVLEVHIDEVVVATAVLNTDLSQTTVSFGLDVSKGDRIGFKVTGDLDSVGGTLNARMLASCFDATGDGGVSQHLIVGTNVDMDNGLPYGNLGAFVVPQACTMTAAGLAFYTSVVGTDHVLSYSLNGGASTPIVTLPIGSQSTHATGLSVALVAGDVIEFTSTGGINGTTGTASVVLEYGATGVVDYPSVPLITPGTNGYAITVNATEDAYELTGPYSDGADGLDGATGPTGPAGLDGATGAAGLDGATGAAGADGATGAAGADGADYPAPSLVTLGAASLTLTDSHLVGGVHIQTVSGSAQTLTIPSGAQGELMAPQGPQVLS